MLPFYQAAWLGCGNVDATAVPASFALRHRCSRNPRFRCVGLSRWPHQSSDELAARFWLWRGNTVE